MKTIKLLYAITFNKVFKINTYYINNENIVN